MTRPGAFKDTRKPLTRQQRACLAKWYELRKIGAVASKDKTSINRYINKHFGTRALANLGDADTNKLYNMLDGWLQSARRGEET